jgi:hypothetical protein
VPYESDESKLDEANGDVYVSSSIHRGKGLTISVVEDVKRRRIETESRVDVAECSQGDRHDVIVSRVSTSPPSQAASPSRTQNVIPGGITYVAPARKMRQLGIRAEFWGVLRIWAHIPSWRNVH